ncbi:hypothetical protein [Thiomonas sp.]|uniref:hypothetical protein n=1 Tax=Thiomonas sp. TaxID=2047785 RepID=UPI00262D4EEA|nr:hypothetical protein [Thiomonas sp.]
MSNRAILKALLAGGLTTLATAAFTVHAASGVHVPLTAVDVLHLAAVDHQAVSLGALRPGQRVVLVNDTPLALQVQGHAARQTG